MEISKEVTEFVEGLKSRGVKLRFEGQILKTRPPLTQPEIAFASKRIPEIYQLINGEEFELPEADIVFSPPKPVVPPEVLVDRVRAHLATKGAYWSWPEACLTGKRGQYDPAINPRNLPSLLEVLERPENRGIDLKIGEMYAFSISGIREDGSEVTVARFSYDGNPVPANQRHLYTKQTA